MCPPYRTSFNKPDTADAANVLIDIGHHIIVMAYVPSITFRTKSSSTFVSIVASNEVMIKHGHSKHASVAIKNHFVGKPSGD